MSVFRSIGEPIREARDPVSPVGRVCRAALRLEGWLHRGWDGYFGPSPSFSAWCFVTGCYYSGTTVLHHLIAAHPSVASLPAEGQALTSELPSTAGTNLERLWVAHPERFAPSPEGRLEVDVARVRRQWGARFDQPEGPVGLVKSPEDVPRLRWIARHWSDARFLGIVRCPYAVVEGLRRKADLDISVAAIQWRRSNQIMSDKFAEVENSVVVRYEELVERPRRVWLGISEWLGLEGTDELPKTELTVHGVTSQLRNMNPNSIDRLTEPEKREITEICGSVMDRYGYRSPSELDGPVHTADAFDEPVTVEGGGVPV